MRYFKLIDGAEWGSDLKTGVIYPEDYKPKDADGINVLHCSIGPFGKDWQEVTEAEYLAQQNQTNKPINDYHAALDAIGQGRIKEIPQHLFDAILKELVDEYKRSWALENGFEIRQTLGDVSGKLD